MVSSPPFVVLLLRDGVGSVALVKQSFIYSPFTIDHSRLFFLYSHGGSARGGKSE